MRPSLALAGLWLLAVASLVLLALRSGLHDLPQAYLAAWLVLVSLPLGALAALMLLELAERPDAAIAGPLRLLLTTLPIMALLFVPILFKLDAIYGWPPGSTLSHQAGTVADGFAAHWFTPFWFGARAVVAFVAWIALSLYFLRPARPSARRRTLAALGLLAHLVLGTLTAYDWYMSLDTAFVSSVFGVVVITSQCVFALTVALVIGVLDEPLGHPRRAAILAMVVTLFVAIYVQFSQYLVVWSANLPKEIVWYQTRWRDVAGPILVYGGPLLVILACAILLPPLTASRRGPVLAALGALIVAEVLDLVALASPRDTFTIPSLSVVGLFLVVIAGLAAASAMALGRRETRQARHG